LPNEPAEKYLCGRASAMCYGETASAAGAGSEDASAENKSSAKSESVGRELARTGGIANAAIVDSVFNAAN
jgi:hypothetical protein